MRKMSEIDSLIKKIENEEKKLLEEVAEKIYYLRKMKKYLKEIREIKNEKEEKGN